jgi:acetate kinase
MQNGSPRRILVVNTGSSSLKAAFYDADRREQPEIVVRAERIGQDDAVLRIFRPDGEDLLDRRADLPDHPAALTALLDWLRAAAFDAGLQAVGHRVVHGGPVYSSPQLVTPALVEAVGRLTPFDPEHLPQALAAIDAVGREYPSIPQVACFDTAFHREMPRIAQRYAIPAELADEGVIRYGFHGLSYESIVGQLREVDPRAIAGRVVIGHLGNGASLAALRDGRGVETTMGFSPTGGLVMGTRSGDLDPGVLLYLLRVKGLDAVQISDLLNRRAGLLGVSGVSGDMRDLLAREGEDPRAAEAIGLFCYQARKHLGGLVAVLGGLDTLVFTGGIGEHAAPIRERISAGFDFLDLGVDPDRNREHAPVISRAGSRVTVRVMRTDEERVILGHTARLIEHQGDHRVRV